MLEFSDLPFNTQTGAPAFTPEGLRVWWNVSLRIPLDTRRNPHSRIILIGHSRIGHLFAQAAKLVTDYLGVNESEPLHFVQLVPYDHPDYRNVTTDMQQHNIHPLPRFGKVDIPWLERYANGLGGRIYPYYPLEYWETPWLLVPSLDKTRGKDILKQIQRHIRKNVRNGVLRTMPTILETAGQQQQQAQHSEVRGMEGMRV